MPDFTNIDIDAKKLVELMQIVKPAENRSKKISSIVENSEKFWGASLNLVEQVCVEVR